ncbi:MAG: DUF4328 domain-containing protein [Pseudomonadota bacterium]
MVETFVSPDSAARWTKGLLLATLALSIVGIGSGLLQIELLSRAASGGISDAEAAANDERQQVVGVLQTIAYIGTAAAFLVWFRRAHRNLPALGGRELKYTSGWAVGAFFVPFLNLVRPLQVMREVWHASDPTGLERDTSASGPSVRNELGTPSLVGWWWAFFLISHFLGNMIARMAFSENRTIDELQTFSALLCLSDVLDVPATLVALVLIGRISNWQDQRAARIAQGATATAQAHGSGA